MLFPGNRPDPIKPEPFQASKRVEDLLKKMTLEEKVGQMTLYTSSWDQTGPVMNDNYINDIKAGKCGNVFNAHTAAYTRELQKIAVEESRLGIPLLFGYDVIHGHKTIFPIPLAEACSWDLGMIEKSARLAAKEAAASGLHWTFNPMVDIARDPRWGRIAEGSGEDVWWGSQIAMSKVRGHQGTDLKDPFTVLACVKHFAAYGAGQAGRDYHTVDISERSLMETYLPPYKAAIDAGAATVMTSFNEINGIPCTGNEWLLREWLKKEWGFNGFIVTDYTSINEMIPHGFSKDLEEATRQSALAGVDMDMQGGAYQSHLVQLVKNEIVPESMIDDAVRRILTLKEQLGLLDDPYRYSDAQREQEVVFSQEMMDHALEAARKSIVLLKNEPFKGSKLLPLSPNYKNIALIGPLADNQLDNLGTWHASGDASKVVTLRKALQDAYPNAQIHYAEGCKTFGNDQQGFEAAIKAAQSADVVILALGENYTQSGEAASRSELDLPGPQMELLQQINTTGKPVVALVMAGRPLVLTWLDENVPAIVNTWHLGTQSGQAIADVLSGKENPSGKLCITFPRNVGQIPIYYSMKNTGRPFDANNKYTSKYLDVSNDPLYPFGYGLSYAEFEYGAIQLNSQRIGDDAPIQASIQLTNKGKVTGEEVVFLFIRDMVGSVTRPVKELKGFQKIRLEPGEARQVNFMITLDDLRFYTQDMRFQAEPGDFKVMIGPNALHTKEADFVY